MRSISFEVSVKKTFREKGVQTIPTDHNTVLDSELHCPIHRNVSASVELPNGYTAEGSIYHGINNWGDYFQIKLKGQKSRMLLREQLRLNQTVIIQMDVNSRRVSMH